jgi:hypothetical protein
MGDFVQSNEPAGQSTISLIHWRMEKPSTGKGKKLDRSSGSHDFNNFLFFPFAGAGLNSNKSIISRL